MDAKEFFFSEHIINTENGAKTNGLKRKLEMVKKDKRKIWETSNW